MAREGHMCMPLYAHANSRAHVCRALASQLILTPEPPSYAIQPLALDLLRPFPLTLTLHHNPNLSSVPAPNPASNLSAVW